MGKRLVKQKLGKEENTGAKFYISIGKVFVGCGIGSLILLFLVHILPQDYEKYNIPLFFGIWFGISFVLILTGLIIMVLCKKSKRFQIWAQNNTEIFAKHVIEKEIQKDKKRRNCNTKRNNKNQTREEKEHEYNHYSR